MMRQILRRLLARLLLVGLGLGALSLAWFLHNRFSAPDRAVLLFENQALQSSSSDSHAILEHLRVVTWNVSMARGMSGGESPWSGGGRHEKVLRCEEIGRFLAELNPHVVVLTEVDFDSSWSGRINMAEIIAKSGGFAWRAEQRNADVSFPFFSIRTGNAVLSKLPILSAVPLELPNPPRMVQWASGAFKIDSPLQQHWSGRTKHLTLQGLRQSARVVIQVSHQTRIEVWPVHLDSRSSELRNFAGEVFQALADKAGCPVILAGDFNTGVTKPTSKRPLTVLDRLLAAGDFSTSRPPASMDGVKSYPAPSPKHAIDRILASKPVEVASLRAMPTTLSDHFPVIAEMRVPSPR